MPRRATSAVGAGGVTTALALVLWLAVHAGTAGGEAPFPVSHWAGPSYGRDPARAQPRPALQDVGDDVLRDRLVGGGVQPGDPNPPGGVRQTPVATPPPPTPSPAPTDTPSPRPTVTPTPSPTVTASPTPRRRFAMEVNMSANRAQAEPGQTIRYTIKVRNAGTDTLHQIVADTHVPTGTVRDGCYTTDGVLVCSGTTRAAGGAEHTSTNIGTLGPGETFTYTLTVMVKHTTEKGDQIRNHAHTTSPQVSRVTSKIVTVTVI